MINKQNLWFVTLFSMILVLGIYYVTLADENLNFEKVVDNSKPVISVSENDSLMALKVANDEKIIEEVTMYENIILNEKSSANDVNDAYDNLQTIQNNITKAEEIETLISEKYNTSAFIKIKNDKISVTISNLDRSANIANNIIIDIQKLYKKQMYITVEFA